MKTIEVPKVSKPCWINGAYTIAFIYSNKGNFILKGFSGDVALYLKELEKIGHKWFGNFTYHRKKTVRGHWKCSSNRVYIHEPHFKPKRNSLSSKAYYYVICNYNKEKENETYISLKRLPTRYVKELFE
jgi:hypothetical protein